MMPTIKLGERLRVDYSAYALGAPKRWDVVAFEAPMFTNQVWVMRIVALPGDSVLITNNTLSINGVPPEIPKHITNVTYVGRGGFGAGSPFPIPKDSYFVLGDNSTNSNDSRYWGALRRSNIVGRVRNK
jgi:signal peptidase I